MYLVSPDLLSFTLLGFIRFWYGSGHKEFNGKQNVCKLIFPQVVALK